MDNLYQSIVTVQGRRSPIVFNYMIEAQNRVKASIVALNKHTSGLILGVKSKIKN